MTSQSPIEIDDYLEKLEFALAVSASTGDEIRSSKIKDKMKMIGFKYQEPSN